MTHSDRSVLLYVEDQKAIQLTMIPVLEDAGFSVLIADDGAAALDILASEKGPIDGVITDVNLGRGPTGWNVARRARLRMSEMPILYASSVGEDEWMVRCAVQQTRDEAVQAFTGSRCHLRNGGKHDDQAALKDLRAGVRQSMPRHAARP